MLMHLHTFAGMAKVPTFSLNIIILLFIAISLPTNSQEFPTKGEMQQRSEQQTDHLHFYFHTILRGPNTSAVVVAQAATTNTYRTRFGEVVMFDNRLTEGPDPSSRVVGRAQGMYAYTDMSVTGLLMVCNYLFTEGKFNGSTLAVMGRYPPRADEIEMSIVGGTGQFRSVGGLVRVAELVNDWERGVDVDEHDVYITYR
ncbi:dirigent protein 1-like [Salvia hispanica]|uniref:dirigent protein 1-like n=1 Tax=Salvia hispanica TaxID=49212 RepID=UPI002009B530|nr:dirigent protein 1-like [Salvia hispanica]